jgi:formate/nitrite transporter FocA (FNT family)
MPAKQRTAEKQEEEIIERTAPPGEVVYEAVYSEGEHELERNSFELGLSGLAAGLSMGFSMVGESVLRVHLPATEWRPLLSKLGYSVGFVIVILGRQQLFTKNTLTVVLPLLREKKMELLLKVGQLWGIVLAANLIGAFIFAWMAGNSGMFDARLRDDFANLAQTEIQPGFGTLILRGALAGWLIALMVWLLPFAESARIWVIIMLAYLVGLCDLPHVVAGTVNAFYLVATSALGFWSCLGSYVVPTFIGNVIGGAALVAFGAHAEFFEAEKQSK